MIVLGILACYLIGSIPFGYLIAKIWNIDIRRNGSGNIGATNVFRSLGILPASLAFALDLLKGTLAVYLMSSIENRPEIMVLGAIAVVVGHAFPVFLKFKGGRGSATGLGTLLAIAPDIFTAAVITAALLVLATRYVSVASIITPVVVTAAFIILKRPLPYTIAAAFVALLILVRHIPNIKRLFSRTENRIW